MKSNLIDVTVQMHAETEKAVLVSDDGDKDQSRLDSEKPMRDRV